MSAGQAVFTCALLAGMRTVLVGFMRVLLIVLIILIFVGDVAAVYRTMFMVCIIGVIISLMLSP